MHKASSKTVLVRLSALTALAMGVWVAYTQTPQAPPQLQLEKIKDDLYAIIGDGGNVAVYVTNEGAILIDDKFERDYADILAKVKSVTDKPVKYLLNTHQHGDHTGGNEKMLGASAEIIAHKNARANMVEGKMPGVPHVSFSDETEVFLGGKEVRAHYFGRGHTNGDAVIYFPALRVLHTGDLMAGTSPLIDYNGGGSVVEWSKTLDNALKLDFDTVIPGHGAITNKAGLQTYRDNVEKMRTRVSGLIHEGKSQAEVAKFMETEYKWVPGSIQQQWSVPGMYQELK
jgi:cyclase